MPDEGLLQNVSPRVTRWVGLSVLTISGFAIVVSGLLIFLGDERGLLLAILGVLCVWVSILVDRESRGAAARSGAAAANSASKRLPVVVTRVTGLLVLALGGFLMVASLVHYFGDEPSAWLGLASIPFSILLIWLGLTIDRDRLRLERRDQRRLEGDPDPDRPEL